MEKSEERMQNGSKNPITISGLSRRESDTVIAKFDVYARTLAE
jgi:hypothetical protein